eukprot:15364421-Ditylum_brightwellii.AAC.1
MFVYLQNNKFSIDDSMWLQYELWADDLAMICIFDDDVANDNTTISYSLYDSENTATGDEWRVKNQCATMYQRKNLKKSSKENAHFMEAICASMMFQNITDIHREMIFEIMESIPVKKGKWVVGQDMVGDGFNVINDG